MKSRILLTTAVVLAGVYITALSGTTINGITTQIISGLTAHGIVVGGGTNDLAVVAPGTSGLPLVSQGSSADPTYATLANVGLTNSSVTINTTGCVSGGGSVALGATLNLTTSCVSFAGVTLATAGATPTWTLQNGDADWTLSTNATVTVTVVAGDKWVHHVIRICQPGSGGPYTVTWPANVVGGMTVGTLTSKCSMQTFDSFDGINLYATSTGIINQ